MKPVKQVLGFGLLIVLVTLCSCDVYFASPQPSWIKKNEKVIPEGFRGTYLSAENGVLHEMHKGGKGDEVEISEKRIFINKDNDYNLSDSVILRKFKSDYFLNIYNREINSWVVVLIRGKQQKLYYYMIPSDDESEIMTRLKACTEVKRLDSRDKEFLINPTRSQFLRMLKSEVFSPMDTLTRIK